MTEKLRSTTIFRVLHRPNLLLGAERELVLSALVLCGGVAATAMNLPALLISAALWVAIIGPLRMMAKADPWMSRIYLRYIKYERYYAARSRPWRAE